MQIDLLALKEMIDKAVEEYGSHCNVTIRGEPAEYIGISKTDWNEVDLIVPSEEIPDHFPPIEYS